MLAERVQERAKGFSLGTAVRGLLAIIPFAIGWCVGILIRAVFLFVAAVIEGYRAGLGIK